MSFDLQSVLSVLKDIPATSTYAAIISTALAVERVVVGYAHKQWKPSITQLRTALANFIAPHNTPAPAPAADAAAATTAVVTTTSAPKA